MVQAEEGGGFDPTLIAKVIRDAGFGAREIRINAKGTLTNHEGRLGLRLPGTPNLLILAGGERFEDLKASRPLASSVIEVEVEGRLRSSYGDGSPGMEVDEWRELDPKPGS